jgi:hypothetical protein
MSQNSRNIQTKALIWTNNKSQPISVADFRNVDLTIVGTGNVTVLASKGKWDVPIDFTSASTIGNSFAQIVIFDETVVATPFVTTLTVAGATKIAEIDTNVLTWICITRSADTVDGFITYSDNQ